LNSELSKETELSSEAFSEIGLIFSSKDNAILDKEVGAGLDEG
jgi:hypothetical protein